MKQDAYKSLINLRDVPNYQKRPLADLLMSLGFASLGVESNHKKFHIPGSDEVKNEIRFGKKYSPRQNSPINLEVCVTESSKSKRHIDSKKYFLYHGNVYAYVPSSCIDRPKVDNNDSAWGGTETSLFAALLGHTGFDTCFGSVIRAVAIDKNSHLLNFKTNDIKTICEYVRTSDAMMKEYVILVHQLNASLKRIDYNPKELQEWVKRKA